MVQKHTALLMKLVFPKGTLPGVRAKILQEKKKISELW